MGWKKKKKNNKRSRDDNIEGAKIDNKRQGYVEAIRENEKFVTYYKAQNIIPDEDEWNKFMEFNKSNLPTCFRITGFRSHSFELRDLMKTKYFPKINEIQFGDDQKSEAPKPLPWYPDELAWQHLAPRNTIKKDPAFQYFHKWLVAETDAGNISRQEAVSMIPTLLLDVKPHHWVFDMCAAPGSKTSQIIEAIHANDSQEIKIPSGIVIANDADSRRSYMLIHQTKRLRSPCLVVTNHDAAQFPSILIKQENSKKDKAIQFDRILADVPCSGDGTLRKNFLIWNKWNVGNPIGLHSMQVKILLRGAQLLKENGRIVYSTCTFNPLENEAVIVEVLKRCRGNLELVDVSDQLPQLIRTPGVKTWKVMDRDGNWVDKIQDIDKNCQKNYPKSLWPPKDIDEFHLERCIRVYPHFQNTGGFFIAVLQKIGPITDVNPIKASESSTESSSSTVIINKNEVIIDNEIVDEEDWKTNTNDMLEENIYDDVYNNSNTNSVVEQIFKNGGEKNDEKNNDNNNKDKCNLLPPSKELPSVSSSSTDIISKATIKNEIVDEDLGINQNNTLEENINDDDGYNNNNVNDVVDINIEQKITDNDSEKNDNNNEDKYDLLLPSKRSSIEESNIEESSKRTKVEKNKAKSNNNIKKKEIKVEKDDSSSKNSLSGEEPFILLSPDNEEIPIIKDFYGLSDEFPVDQILVRSETEKNKTLYLVSSAVKTILQAINTQKLRIVNTGVKLFTRHDTYDVVRCNFRCNAEGISTIFPFLSSKRVINLGLKELEILLSEPNPLFSKFDEDVNERIKELDSGCIIAYFDPTKEKDTITKIPIMLPVWKAPKSLNLLYRKEERRALELRFQHYFKQSE